MRAAVAIDRVQSPTAAGFDDLLRLGRPVVITGAIDDWPALSAWTPDYLKSKCGHRPVQVTPLAAGVFNTHSAVEMALGKFIDVLQSDTPENDRHYCTVTQFETRLPELVEDLPTPAFIRGRGPRSLRLFYGSNTYTGCHYHPFQQAVLTQVSGRKRVVMFSPRDFRHLYPTPVLSLHYNWSRLEHLDRIDPAQFPALDKAQPLECVLQPGEMLFIPVQWTHAVYGLGKNLAVTYFWDCSTRRWTFPRPGLRCLLHKVLDRLPRLGKRRRPFF